MGAAKKIDKVITLQDFVNKSIEKYNNRPLVADLEVNGDLIPFSRPTNDEMLRYIDGIAKAINLDPQGNYTGQDTTIMFEISKDFVFSSCKFLHDKGLQEAFEVVEPTDVVVKVFGIEGTIDIAQQIKDAFDGVKIAEKVDSTIKN